MDSIRICDLEVFYHVGVPDDERAKLQRLLISVEMESDFGPCAAADEISQTIDYFAVSQRLLTFGKGRSWKLIETLASEIAEMILREFRPFSVKVEVKKFIIPEAGYVSVSLSRRQGE